jgi:enoyl-CoA hydratase/carnithine racemase
MASTYQTITLSIDDRVARITLSRPPLNVFNLPMMKEITAALAECNEHELVAIVFASAAGARAFSAGVAVEDHLSDTVYQMLDSFHAIFGHWNSWADQLSRWLMVRRWAGAVNWCRLRHRNRNGPFAFWPA